VASTRISALPAAAPLAGPEILPAVQSGGDVGVTAAQLALFASGLPGFISGNWYMPFGIANVVAGAALAQGSIRFVPFILPAPMTVKALAVRITTAGTSNLQLALYASSGGRPSGNALAATSSIANTSTGLQSASVTPAALTPGLAWMAVNCNDSACVTLTSGLNNPQMSALVGSATLGDINGSGANTGLFLTFAQSFGTWPNMTGQTCIETVPSGAGANSCSILMLQAN